MPDSPWWTTLSTADLLELRRRLLHHVTSDYNLPIDAELEDVVQQAFVVLFRRREAVSPDDDGLFRYLRTVARNEAVNRIRARDRQKAHAVRVASSVTEHAETGMAAPPPDHVEPGRKMFDFFCALSEIERLILWSHVVDGKSIRTVAREFGLNWHRVAGILDRVLRMARRNLDT